MTDSPNVLNRRHFLECLSALGLGSTVMPEALTIAAQGSAVVTLEVLEAAQRIAGVSFTQAEQQAIISRLNGTSGYMAGAAFLRGARLGDDDQPAVVFNPLPPGKTLPSGPRGLIRRAPEVSRPSSDETLAFLSVTHLAALIQTRQITPSELTELYLSRLAKFDPSCTALSPSRPNWRARRPGKQTRKSRPAGIAALCTASRSA